MSLKARSPREAFERFDAATDLPLAALALLIVPALIPEDRATSHLVKPHVSPITPEGRLIAVGLMIVGIGCIGVFTASLTSFFLQPDEQEDDHQIEARLARIEAQLSELLARERRS